MKRVFLSHIDRSTTKVVLSESTKMSSVFDIKLTSSRPTKNYIKTNINLNLLNSIVCSDCYEQRRIEEEERQRRIEEEDRFTLEMEILLSHIDR